MMAHGYVDQFAYSVTHAGWLLAGWIPVTQSLARSLPTQSFTGDFAAKPAGAGAAGKVVFFERADLKNAGVGVVCLIKGASDREDAFRQLWLRFGNQAFRMDWVAATTELREQEMIQRCRGLVASGFGSHQVALAAGLRVDAFTGHSTFESLPQFVRMGIDEVIVGRSGSAVILGWMLAWPGTVTAQALCTEAGVFSIDPAAMVRTERLDVLDSVGRSWGFDDSRCGFVAFLPKVEQAARQCWFRIETSDGGVAYATAPGRRLHGMRAIRRILDVIDLHDDDIRLAYDRVVGPACRDLNAERLAKPPTLAPTRFGTPDATPRVSVVVPLYGRLDYLEYQLASFAHLSPGRSWELIYVLDDPARRREAMALAESALARFGLPFHLLTLDENRGFAPACNVGLHAAQGEFVCFLNSDTLPVTAAFLDRLADRLAAAPSLGLVGALLLFEDGSVQHEGMVMQPLRTRGDLRFPLHPRKGWRPRLEAGLEPCDMVTGACMMLRRDTATRLGGFEEGFVIGDFEDADLCARIRDAGQSIAVDHHVRLFHFERQSQTEPDQRWRSNLTTFNAWLYDQRHPADAAR